MAFVALLAGIAIGYMLGHRRPPVAIGTPAPVMAPIAAALPADPDVGRACDRSISARQAGAKVVRLVGHRKR